MCCSVCMCTTGICVCVSCLQAEGILKAWATPALEESVWQYVTEIWNNAMTEVCLPKSNCPDQSELTATHSISKSKTDRYHRS
jgi:hypothetical protein